MKRSLFVENKSASEKGIEVDSFLTKRSKMKNGTVSIPNLVRVVKEAFYSEGGMNE